MNNKAIISRLKSILKDAGYKKIEVKHAKSRLNGVYKDVDKKHPVYDYLASALDSWNGYGGEWEGYVERAIKSLKESKMGGSTKLTDLLSESKFAFDRKFGEPLPTIADTTKIHSGDKEETVTEAKKDAKYYKELLYKVRNDIDELISVGADFGVWQSAQATHKYLKKAKKDLEGIG